MAEMKRVLIQIVLILLVSLGLGCLVNLVHPKAVPWSQDWDHYTESRARESGVKVVSLKVALELHKGGSALFVDARPEEEFAAGHIAGAVSLPLQTLEDHFDVFDQMAEWDGPVVVYCSDRMCDDALVLAIELQELGIPDLLYYVDGYLVWRRFGDVVGK